MKTIVKLAVLLAALLLFFGEAPAPTMDYCHCYSVTPTPLDVPAPSEPFYTRICFNGETEGTVSGLCGVCDENNDPLFIFFDPMNRQALTYHLFENSYCVVYLKFHGDHNYVLNGLRFIDVDGRTAIHGYQTDMSYCDEICD